VKIRHVPTSSPRPFSPFSLRQHAAEILCELDISEEDGACHASYLGLLEVKKSGDRVALPRDKMVDIEVLFTSESIGGRSGSQASVAYRFKSLAGENYILDIIDNGRSRGFQVYRAGANGKPAGEVAYISRRYCR
jgi:hypothetical protein